MDEVKRLGNIYGENRGTGFAGNVWDKNGILPALTTMQGGGREPMILDKICVAMRGRNPEKPTDRTAGMPTEQRLEVNMNGTTNTLTTVQKDNLVLEQDCVEIKQATKEGSIKCKVGGCYDASFPGSTTRRGRVQEGGDVAPTLTAGSNENIRYVETIYRLRKLTPRECWRLMGYTDTDFDKAQKVNSNSQLYKEAGNAIVKQVLMAIFAQMIPESARKL